MKIRFIVCLVLLLSVQIDLIAQNNKKLTKELSSDDISYVLVDLSYINDAVFMGRRDSIASPYIFPSIGYYDKSGFFADASISYLVGSEENRIDLSLLSAGYVFASNQFSGGISGTKYFFNNDSYNVQSEIVGDISGFLGYDFKVVEISIMASSYFNDGSSVDIFTRLILDHTFYSSDTNFLIVPSISINAGSQYFYEEYYSTSRLGNRKGKGMGTGSSELPVASFVSINEVSDFNVLSIELSLPIQYYHNSFIFSFSPTLSIPRSSATITTENAIIEEKLENIFYMSAGISYWFNTKKNN